MKVVTIDQILDEFKKQYAHIQVEPSPVDITDCFRSINGFDGPNSYGDLTINQVLAYVVLGEPFLEKYELDPKGILCFNHGRPKVREFDNTAKVMSCLCVCDLRNTSLHEIRATLKRKATIQGYTRQHLRNIEQTLLEAYPLFNPDNDTAFIFADKPGIVLPRLQLNALWLSQIVSLGKITLATMDKNEAELMELVFPASVLDGNNNVIRQRSYMYGKDIHTEESVEFLRRKVEKYHNQG